MGVPIVVYATKLDLTLSPRDPRAAEVRYWRAVGSAQSLIEKAAAIGQRWLKGVGSAEKQMRPQPT